MLNSEMMRELKEEISTTPLEVSHKNDIKSDTAAELKEWEDIEESNFVRISGKRKLLVRVPCGFLVVEGTVRVVSKCTNSTSGLDWCLHTFPELTPTAAFFIGGVCCYRAGRIGSKAKTVDLTTWKDALVNSVSVLTLLPIANPGMQKKQRARMAEDLSGITSFDVTAGLVHATDETSKVWVLYT